MFSSIDSGGRVRAAGPSGAHAARSEADGRLEESADASYAIRARDLVKSFGARRALDGVDLAVPRGAFVTVFGPNGAGKTTLLRILATLSRPTSGSLELLGTDALHDDPRQLREHIGMISHRSMVYADLTARENLLFFARLYGVAEPEGRVADLLELVELDHRANDQAGTFSRGMSQRLSIARALINDPDLILLDEPYAGLDPHGMRLLDELIERIRPGRTFVMVSHDLDRGYALCTHALILARGRVVLHGARSDLDADDFRKTYLSVVGSLTSDVEAG